MWRENKPMPTWIRVMLTLITIAGMIVLFTSLQLPVGPTAVLELVFYTKVETAAIIYLGLILSFYVSRRG